MSLEEGYRPPWTSVLIEALGSKCKRCGTNKNIVIDHVIPLSVKGTHELSNTQLLCTSCHGKKTHEDNLRRFPKESGELKEITRMPWNEKVSYHYMKRRSMDFLRLDHQ